jgi:putative heme iron utilization protein
MVTVATEVGGAPIFLISQLAWHTRNIEADPRASVLFVAPGESGDPLALGRISVMGAAEKADTPLNRARFLARHPEAAGYASFADFSLWRLRLEKGHFVSGFGRIRTLPADRLIRQGEAVAAWEAGVAAALDEINARDAALCADVAVRHGGQAGEWRLAACDPDGCDLVSGGQSIRAGFAEPIESIYQIPEALQRLRRNGAKSP